MSVLSVLFVVSIFPVFSRRLQVPCGVLGTYFSGGPKLHRPVVAGKLLLAAVVAAAAGLVRLLLFAV